MTARVGGIRRDKRNSTVEDGFRLMGRGQNLAVQAAYLRMRPLCDFASIAYPAVVRDARLGRDYPVFQVLDGRIVALVADDGSGDQILGHSEVSLPAAVWSAGALFCNALLQHTIYLREAQIFLNVETSPYELPAGLGIMVGMWAGCS
jgi:hypothetical protein